MALFIYICVLCLSLGITIFIAGFALSQAESRKIVWFTAMLASLFFYLLGSLLGTLAITTDAAFNGTRVEYLGAGFIGPVTLFFIADYCKIIIRNVYKTIMLSTSLVLILLLWTTPIHGLVYESFELSEIGFSGLRIISGPMHFYPHIYGLICILISTVMILNRCLVWNSKHRSSLILLLFTALIPAIVNIVYAMNFMSLNQSGIQITPISMSIACIFLWFNIVKLNMFDILSQAMKIALQFTKEAFILIDADNNFLYANESAVKIFPELDTMKKGLPINIIENWPFEMEGYNTGSAQKKFEIKGTHYYAASIDAIINANLKLLGHIILIQNNTEIVLSAKKAEQSNQAKSSFIATVSHEIRSPMNAIIGITQIQLQNKNLPLEYASAFEKIHYSSTNLLSIINDILDMSKIETGKMDIIPLEYDVPVFIQETVQLNLILIGSKPIKFIVDIDEKLPVKIIGDELRIRQVLNNLLSNAIKYTEKGHVKLSIKHSLSGDDLLLHFTVEDTGQGIKQEDIDKLFFSEYIRFNNDINKNTEGTGIGLNITKNLVELMGGTIEVESEYGLGSTFTVKILQKTVECDAIGNDISKSLNNLSFSGKRRKAKTKINRNTMPNGKVLIVDDLELNIYVAKGLLSPYEIQIDTAISGFIALEKVENGQIYDIIFMDHMMPLMDGIETTKKLRNMGYDGIIVALTANALAGNAEMFKANGFDDFIAKPINVDYLDTVLNKFIKDSEKRKENKEKVNSLMVNPELYKVFCRDAEKAVITLREIYTNGDITAKLSLFTTTVHAMKSALANIGENDKSASASMLENAGLIGDLDFIKVNIDNFIESLENLIKDLNPPKTALIEDKFENDFNDKAYLIENLKLIKSACEEYNDTAAYNALDSLKGKPWDKEIISVLDEIHDMLFLHSDFENTVLKMNVLLKELNI